jgi:hypothetical protein
MTYLSYWGGPVLTDSEVDRRFSMLVADLNSALQTVDWPGVSASAEREPPDDTNGRDASDAGIIALRVLAVATAFLTFAAGVVLARTFDLGILPIIVWVALVVPGVTLATLMIVDRLPRRR